MPKNIFESIFVAFNLVYLFPFLIKIIIRIHYYRKAHGMYPIKENDMDFKMLSEACEGLRFFDSWQNLLKKRGEL